MNKKKSTKTIARVIILSLAIALLVLIVGYYIILPAMVIKTFSNDEVKNILSEVVKAPLPKTINDFHGEAIFVFTAEVRVRFSTTQNQLEDFLKQSPFLPDVLKTDYHALSRYPFGEGITEEYNWWRPDKLTHDVLGEKLTWHDKPNNVDFCIMAGKENPDDDELIVYIYFILERHATPYTNIQDANSLIQ